MYWLFTFSIMCCLKDFLYMQVDHSNKIIFTSQNILLGSSLRSCLTYLLCYYLEWNLSMCFVYLALLQFKYPRTIFKAWNEFNSVNYLDWVVSHRLLTEFRSYGRKLLLNQLTRWRFTFNRWMMIKQSLRKYCNHR